MSYINFIKICIILLIACTINNIPAGLPDVENKTSAPNYINVDIEIKYDLDGTDCFENVDVFEKKKDKKLCLVIWHKEDGYCEILVLEGMKVYIYEHNSCKLLKIYSLSK